MTSAASPASRLEQDVELACVLPARNCEADLPDYLRSVQGLADAVVALDDGSTDRTAEILESHPVVRVMIRNPPREGYEGWDDRANRQALLRAAGGLHPKWILWLDADERIDADDAAALRAFVERDALPGVAYGFRVHRMIEGMGAYDRDELWVYRLFAWAPDADLPDGRLHFVPIPTSIPRSRWMKTSIRIQHIAGSSEARRRARLEKYRQADPLRRYQDTYEHLVEPPSALHLWRPRTNGEHVLNWGTRRQDVDLSSPVLSAVIIAQNDESTIDPVVRAAVDQHCDDAFEVIVVASGTDRTAEIVRTRFPNVRLIELPEPALPGRARNAGLQVARGEFISFPGSHVEVEEGCFGARISAHERGFAMVTGSIINGTLTRSGWASYFLDHSSALPDRPSEELLGPPAHCSYDRDVLLAIGGFPEDMRAGEDTIVNNRLWKMGYRAYRAREIQLTHRSPCGNPLRLVRHHFTRGRAMGRILLGGDDDRGSRTVRLRFWLWSYVRRRVSSTSGNVLAWADPEMTAAYRGARHFVLAGACAALAGMWVEILRRLPRRLLHRRRLTQSVA